MNTMDINKIKIEETSYDEKNSKLKKYIDECKKIDINLLELLPTIPLYTVSFVTSGGSEWAILVHNFVMYEQKVFGINGEIENFNKDYDPFNPSNLVIRAFSYIPINQDYFDDIKDDTKVDITIDKKNTTNSHMKITSKELDVKIDGKKVDLCEFIMPIFTLNHGFAINGKFDLVQRYTFDDARYTPTARGVYHKLINGKLIEKKDLVFGTGVDNSNEFYQSYDTRYNTRKPLRFLKGAFEEIIKRCEKIKAELKEPEEPSEEKYYKIIISGGMTKVEFSNECIQLINFIKHLIMIKYGKKIPMIAVNQYNPDSRICFIKMTTSSKVFDYIVDAADETIKIAKKSLSKVK